MMLPSRDRFIHTVDLFIADTEATDSSGSLTLPLGPSTAAIPCLVMDKGGSRAPAFDRSGLERKKVRVLFCDAIDLREGHYLKYIPPSGSVRWLVIDSFRDDQDMGRLWVAECFLVPDPSGGQS